MRNTFIIAELSANHNGRLDIALQTIRAAKLAGADAIKIQTYRADTITIDSNKDDFVIKGGIWDGKKMFDLYKEAYTPWEWHETIFRFAKEEGLICFSSPFDKSAVDLLERLGNPIYKIASFEITDIGLIEYCAKTLKPIMISTGIATIEDIELAIETCKKAGNSDITLLKCTSVYPASIKDANLLTILDLKERFDVKVGLSDHTLGSDVSLAAAAIGAEVIEKHFILDRKNGGPDSDFSMNKEEFAAMVKSIRNIEHALGKIEYPIDDTKINGRQFCRSLYVVENIKAGEIITERNVRSIRPGYGMHPKYLKTIIGKKAKNNIEKGTRFEWGLINV